MTDSPKAIVGDLWLDGDSAIVFRDSTTQIRSTSSGVLKIDAPTVNLAGGITEVDLTVSGNTIIGDAVTDTCAITGATTITSTSASALTVGANGATNPVLKINASASTIKTGVSITGAAAAGGVAVAAISSGTNENLTIDAKGSGTITLAGTSTGRVTITPVTTITGVLTSTGGITANNPISFTGATPAYSVYSTAGTGGRNAPFINVGSWDAPMNIVLASDHRVPIQVNLKNTGNVAFDVAAARLRVDTGGATASTNHNVLELWANVGHNVNQSAVVQASADYSGNMAITTGEAVIGYFSLDGAGSITLPGSNNASAIIGSITNSGTFTGTANVCWLRTGASSTITNMLKISNLGTCTTGIAVDGTLTTGISLPSTCTTGIASASPIVITSASANALAVGLNGSTNPAFIVDASTASSATGIKIKSAASGGGVAISALGGTNEALAIDAKGSGTITLGGTSTGAIAVSRALNLTGDVAFGVDGTGVDANFFGDTASAKMMRDMSEDALVFSGLAKVDIGVTGTPLVLTAGTPIFEMFTTCASTDGGTSAQPFHLKTTMTGAGGVGGRAKFEMTTNVALAGWSNALKAQVDYGASGKTTGLGSAFCSEMTLSAGTVDGNYAPLESELVLGSGAKTGTLTSFLHCATSGADSGTFDTNGGIMNINVGAAASGKVFQTNNNTASHALRIFVNGVAYYILLSDTSD